MTDRELTFLTPLANFKRKDQFEGRLPLTGTIRVIKIFQRLL